MNAKHAKYDRSLVSDLYDIPGMGAVMDAYVKAHEPRWYLRALYKLFPAMKARADKKVLLHQAEILSIARRYARIMNKSTTKQAYQVATGKAFAMEKRTPRTAKSIEQEPRT
jgi:hypothetical protein